MTTTSLHAEWLSLIDISGPFLAEPVLKEAFPQGLEEIESSKRRTLRQAYDEWREAQELDDPDFSALHAAWVDLVLRQGLELDEDAFKAQADLLDSVRCDIPERGVTLRPDYAVVNDQKADEPLMLVSVYEPSTSLDEPLKIDGWPASPSERMVELCRANGVRLGLITNGERWMLVDAPVGAVTSFASWYANLWGQEPKTLQAFVNLLGVRRFFVDRSEQLPALLDDSLKLQDEVTDALGEQVRRAVEVLIQRLDRADLDLNRTLLEGVTPTELYESALTVMMRIVFLLSAEERGLLLMGDERYEANYAVSTLRMQLRGEAEEILERRQDAWSRLLAIFRAVYGGIEHEAMRLPALGGSLFDPDRFQFLEGRPKHSIWKTDPARPLPIDNRTVLLLLDAVQLFQGRTLSYRALDVEQIGYVYEGLLERTVVRAKDVTLDLDATKSAKKPWVTLDELEDAATKGDAAMAELLKERTGSAPSRVSNDLAKKIEEADADKLLTACHGDQGLRDRIRPYFHLLRPDSWGYPLVYPVGTLMVTTGADRRETGTHYTPKVLTEEIVRETLEPIVYAGPTEGKPREEWALKSPAEILVLKICDPAMGSGAFLVQVCRWLSERLVEAWSESEASGSAVTSEGVVVEKRNGYEPLRNDPEERLLTARRLIAERCLYGVDMNPLAVELAKLSIWLVTLAKGRPFGFLDHNLRFGDSLLGISNLDQLLYLNMTPGKGSSKMLFAAKIDEAVADAIALRAELRSRPIRDIRDVEVMASLDSDAREKLKMPGLIADALIAEFLSSGGGGLDVTSLSIEAGRVIDGDMNAAGAMRRRANEGLRVDLASEKGPRRPFNWPLEFPEVFLRDSAGFDAIVGNPPFLGGQKITGVMGTAYREYLVEKLADGTRGSADLVAYFFLRVYSLLAANGFFGLLAVNTIAEGNTREAGLDRILAAGGTIFKAYPSEPWPGAASVVTSRVHLTKGRWNGLRMLSGRTVDHISSYLGATETWEPIKLNANAGLVYQGTIILGDGFLIDDETVKELISSNPKYEKVIYPYLIGREVNQSPDHKPGRWVINFFDWPRDRAEKYKAAFEKVERDVKPERDKNNRKVRRERWWQYAERASGLYHAIGRGDEFLTHPKGWDSASNRLEQVIAFATGATKYPCFTVVSNDSVFANSLCVIASESLALFASLSSDIHAVWAFEHGSRLHERLRYTHGDIFETFPFPSGVLTNEGDILSDLGRSLFEMRRGYMIANEKGMTKFYNDFHDPDCDDETIVACRKLQMEINKAVLIAYGIDDIELNIGFHEVGYLPSGKNTRFTMSEASRSQILKRLALLNKERHEAETNKTATLKYEKSKQSFGPDDTGDLFAQRERAG